ncbi:hypothetical protein BSK20_00095 [SR1 bacterium human oral taxon HOT-345]|nr:hypothetical protein BSK20_00095 [SR1 bacterium human oral taxon HOT-345]
MTQEAKLFIEPQENLTQRTQDIKAEATTSHSPRQTKQKRHQLPQTSSPKDRKAMPLNITQ